MVNPFYVTRLSMLENDFVKILSWSKWDHGLRKIGIVFLHQLDAVVLHPTVVLAMDRPPRASVSPMRWPILGLVCLMSCCVVVVILRGLRRLKNYWVGLQDLGDSLADRIDAASSTLLA